MKITFGKFVSAYAIIALLTFGYAVNADWKERSSTINGVKIDFNESNFILGTLCGMVWPMYWSYKLFAWARKP